MKHSVNHEKQDDYHYKQNKNTMKISTNDHEKQRKYNEIEKNSKKNYEIKFKNIIQLKIGKYMQYTSTHIATVYYDNKTEMCVSLFK